MVHFTYLMHASSCPLLCIRMKVWLVLCSVAYKHCLNLSHTKFVPISDTIFFGKPDSVNTILAVLIRSSAERPSAFFTIGNLL